MRYILTSSDKHLRSKFNSNDFRNNFDMDYNQVTKEYKDVLRLPGNITPIVGDYLYFIDNYYRQIPVKVVRLAYGAMSTCMICCEKAELWEIDPSIYAAPNDFHRKYTEEFEDKITHAAWNLQKKFPELIEKAQKEYENENVYELGIIVKEIIRYTDIDNNTCIDYTNIKYAVCEILQKNGFEQAKDWHRPERYEYSDM